MNLKWDTDEFPKIFMPIIPYPVLFSTETFDTFSEVMHVHQIHCNTFFIFQWIATVNYRQMLDHQVHYIEECQNCGSPAYNLCSMCAGHIIASEDQIYHF